jgi:hypothetical protein
MNQTFFDQVWKKSGAPHFWCSFYVFLFKLQKNQANEEKDETPTEGTNQI